MIYIDDLAKEYEGLDREKTRNSALREKLRYEIKYAGRKDLKEQLQKTHDELEKRYYQIIDELNSLIAKARTAKQ